MRTVALLGCLLQAACIQFGCVAEGTRILTPDGTRAIEDMHAGDTVVSSRGESHVAAVVRHTADRHLRLTLSDGSALEVTGSHPLAGVAGWRTADALRAGDRVRSRDGWLRIERVETVRGPACVYDLAVAPWHDFYAGSVLVHNKTVAPPPDPDEIPGAWVASDGLGYDRLVLHADGSGTLVEVVGKSPEVSDVTWTLVGHGLTLQCRPRAPGRRPFELTGSGNRHALRLDEGRLRFLREERWHEMERRARDAD